jgi:hypothetical protein
MKTKILIFSMLLLAGTATALAQSGTYGENLTWSLENGTLTISGTGAMANYEYNTLPWYSYRLSITTIVIEDGVTSIGKSAFSGCNSLTKVTIPNGVTSIGDWAFSGCSSLTKVTIPNGVTSIGDAAFLYCSRLTEVTIPNSVTSIGGGAFERCSSLTEVTIPNSVTSIGGGAFNTCSSLTAIIVENGNANYSSEDGVLFNKNKTTLICCPEGKTGSYTIPNSVTSIERGAFYVCSGLTSVMIPNSVTSIGNSAFAYCRSLTEVTIPNSVTSIGWYAFDGCSSLTEVTIPYSVTSIGVGAFEGTDWLNKQPDGCIYIGKVLYKYKGNMPLNTTINVVEGTLCINGVAFSYCSGLVFISIPSSVTSIGTSAFYHCSSLTAIIVENGNANYSSEDGVLFNKNKATLICCPEGKTGSYTIPNSVTSIGEDAFYGCSGLTSVMIPNSVTSIGDSAFSGCSGLTSVMISNSVTSIGGYAFSRCSSLTAIIVENGNANYSSEDGVLFNKNKTTLICCPGGKTGSYTIPNSVTSIEGLAFSGCSSLTEVTIPNSVTSIGGNAFDGCSSLTEITIPNSVTSIESFFYGCSSLTEVTIPASVTTIGNYAFYDCPSLTSVTNLNPTPQNIIYLVFSSADLAKATLYVPAESVEAYRTADVWKDFGTIAEYAPSAINTPVFDGFAVPTQVIVSDMNGRIVWRQTVKNGENIAIGHLPQSVYLVKIVIGNQSVTKKIIKQ